MSTRLALIDTWENRAVARVLTCTPPPPAANDSPADAADDADSPDISGDIRATLAYKTLLRLTLEHFAAHGLAAAALARDHAEAAHYAGNLAQAAQWLAICAVLDKRMAEAMQRRWHTAHR